MGLRLVIATSLIDLIISHLSQLSGIICGVRTQMCSAFSMR
jgi:hypothetical protein